MGFVSAIVRTVGPAYFPEPGTGERKFEVAIYGRATVTA